jgi:ZIP family zinc transporter
MGLSFFWGAVGALALVAGALIAYAVTPNPRFTAVVMALGTGVLIGSVSFELIDEAIQAAEVPAVGLLTLIGAATFTVGNWWLARGGGGKRKDMAGAQQEGSPLAIVLGSVIDGIPESFVLGLTVLQGQVSTSLLAGVLLSNFPEGLASSSGLRAAGWARRKVLLMWSAVVVAAGLSAALGYVLLDPATGRTGALVQAFAAGGLLAMVSDTLLPEAYAEEGVFTGSLVAVGFAVSLMLSGWEP